MANPEQEGYKMAPAYDDGPELAPHAQAPEVYQPEVKQFDGSQVGLDDQHQYHQSYNSAYGSTPVTSPYPNNAQLQSEEAAVPEEKKKQGFFGPTTMAVIIAFLAIAVIGLAAGTGVAVGKYNDALSKYNDAESKYQQANQKFDALNYTTTFNYLSNGCSDQDLNTTGPSYTTQNPHNRTKYTVRCNANIAVGPFYSLFATNFNSCMEACSVWNTNYNYSQTCRSVNYIPDWTTLSHSWADSAPGNCYLKDGNPIFDGTKPGVETHSGILDS